MSEFDKTTFDKAAWLPNLVTNLYREGYTNVIESALNALPGDRQADIFRRIEEMIQTETIDMKDEELIEMENKMRYPEQTNVVVSFQSAYSITPDLYEYTSEVSAARAVQIWMKNEGLVCFNKEREENPNILSSIKNRNSLQFRKGDGFYLVVMSVYDKPVNCLTIRATIPPKNGIFFNFAEYDRFDARAHDQIATSS